MSVSGYYNREKLLKVGNTYTFRYVKSVVLEDSNRYMVFEDIYGMRHFLDFECYKPYNLIESSEVVCRVEKVNCTGRIYLEPVHPVYKPGNEHTFEISSIIETEEGHLLSVHDCFGNLLSIKIIGQSFTGLSIGDMIVARIENIKRALPDLTFICIETSLIVNNPGD